MEIVFFFRNSNKGQHSIEELFANIQMSLPDDVLYQNFIVKYKSKGILRRLINSFQAFLYQGEINHITGDIHYIACFLKKNKTILTIHDINSILNGSWLKRMLIKLFWFTIPVRMVAHITVISEFSKQELLKHISINPQKIRVIHNCISPLITYSPKEFNEDMPSILQIGTKSNKNIPALLNALEGVKCKLIIVGPLSEKQILILNEKKIEYENYCDIEFLELLALYKNADILTLISTYEGFGVPIIEAQAIGRPVITSNIGSMPEVAGDGALLVNPNDVVEIKSQILKIIENETCREELIQKGLNNAKRFNAKIISEEYCNLYKEVHLKR